MSCVEQIEAEFWPGILVLEVGPGGCSWDTCLCAPVAYIQNTSVLSQLQHDLCYILTVELPLYCLTACSWIKFDLSLPLIFPTVALEEQGWVLAFYYKEVLSWWSVGNFLLKGQWLKPKENSHCKIEMLWQLQQLPTTCLDTRGQIFRCI